MYICVIIWRNAYNTKIYEGARACIHLFEHSGPSSLNGGVSYAMGRHLSKEFNCVFLFVYSNTEAML